MRKGLPFRAAHGVVGRLVSLAVAQHKQMKELSLAEYQEASALRAPDVFEISLESSLAARDVTGGTAPKQVRAASLGGRAGCSGYSGDSKQRAGRLCGRCAGSGCRA